MVYVQTLKGISCTIEGNKIIEQQEAILFIMTKK